MSTVEPRTEDPEVMKGQWLEHLGALVSNVKRWVEASGWRTRLITKGVTEPGLGRYEVPILLMERREAEVVLSPVARVVPGADGVVDLYLMPGYDDLVSLYLEGGRWFIHDVLPPDPTAPRPAIEADRLPLDEDSIDRVLNAVVPHA